MIQPSFLKKFSLILCLIFGIYSQAFLLHAQTADGHLIQKSIEYLASEKLQGRLPGSQGDSLAAEFIRRQFLASGLTLKGNQGFQRFDIITDIKPGTANYFRYSGKELKTPQDFIPVSFSKNAHLQAGICFVGYGFQIKTDSLNWNDYHNLDVKGKWVILLRGAPDLDNPKSIFHAYSSDRQKVLQAKDLGAGGVILVNSVALSRTDDLMKLSPDHNFSDAGVPVINMSRSIANQILQDQNITVEQREKEYNQEKKAHAIQLKGEIDAGAELNLTLVKTYNILGMLEGSDPVLKKEIIVMGGQGSSSRMPDTTAIHYGADDNASGVSAVIAIADAFHKKNIKPKRSILFIAFGAEEAGLLGSKYFVKNPTGDIKSLVCMMNFDMVGRLKKDKPTISVSGIETALQFKKLSASHPLFDSIPIQYSPDGFGPSDHASFFGQNIPVLYITTGVHTDYHTPNDHPSRINYSGCTQTVDFSLTLLKDLLQMDSITYNPASVTYNGNGNRTSLKVTLGIIPDVTNSSKGLLVEGVKKDGPAHQGGIIKGDIILAVDGKGISNIYDYMSRLQQLEVGKTIPVDVERNGERIILLIKL